MSETDIQPIPDDVVLTSPEGQPDDVAPIQEVEYK